MRLAAEQAVSGRGNAKGGSFLQLPENVPVVVMSDSSDAQQAAAVMAVLGMVDDGEPVVAAVAIDVEWPCDAWEGSGCASIVQANTLPPPKGDAI